MVGRRGRRWSTKAERLEIRRRVATGERTEDVAIGVGRSKRTVRDQAHLDTVARELNGRPRQTLGWMKPSEALVKVVALTG